MELKTLCDMQGISGREELVRMAIHAECVEKLGADAEATVKFDQVLAVLDGENTKIGAPTVEGASVEAKVVKNGKGKKLDIIRYKSKKNEKKHIGHRQPYTKVEITKIAL